MEAPNRFPHPRHGQIMRGLLLLYEDESICYLRSNKIITKATYLHVFFGTSTLLYV